MKKGKFKNKSIMVSVNIIDEKFSKIFQFNSILIFLIYY